jgi:histidinol-phosphatase (PHP family)
MPIEEVIKKTRELNIGAIITEHIDMNYPDPSAFKLDVEGYFAEYDAYRNNALLLGIEVGMGIDEVEENRRLVEAQSFDYVLGSIHIIDNIDIYDEIFYQGKSKEEVYNRYFETTLECLQAYDYIDSLGHIDYIARYARFEDREIYYDQHAEYIDEVLKLLIKKGKALEVNTRRLANPVTVNNVASIYKRYGELGGKWITIGSDAHVSGDVGKHFQIALELAQFCNLKPVYYKTRKMQYCSL